MRLPVVSLTHWPARVAFDTSWSEDVVFLTMCLAQLQVPLS
jgi:hypothetical protein